MEAVVPRSSSVTARPSGGVRLRSCWYANTTWDAVLERTWLCKVRNNRLGWISCLPVHELTTGLWAFLCMSSQPYRYRYGCHASLFIASAGLAVCSKPFTLSYARRLMATSSRGAYYRLCCAHAVVDSESIDCTGAATAYAIATNEMI